MVHGMGFQERCFAFISGPSSIGDCPHTWREAIEKHMRLSGWLLSKRLTDPPHGCAWRVMRGRTWPFQSQHCAAVGRFAHWVLCSCGSCTSRRAPPSTHAAAPTNRSPRGKWNGSWGLPRRLFALFQIQPNMSPLHLSKKLAVLAGRVCLRSQHG
jgi:hypothetical protein